jgi:hypothetical protein
MCHGIETIRSVLEDVFWLRLFRNVAIAAAAAYYPQKWYEWLPDTSNSI